MSQRISLHHMELPNLGPKLVPSNKKLPFMGIVTSADICALRLGMENQTESAEL